MTDPRDVVPRSVPRQTEDLGGRGVVLVLTFLFVLAAVSVSTGLVVYTASRHNLADGLFALGFAVLSARAALSWYLVEQPANQLVSRSATSRAAKARGRDVLLNPVRKRITLHSASPYTLPPIPAHKRLLRHENTCKSCLNF